MRLTLKLTPAATSMTWNKDVGTTSGRFFLSNNNQVEWISFTGKTNNGDGTYTYTGLTRGLSQTADPVTGGTGSTWLANQECILVAMHDQLVDKTQATTFADTITFAKNANFTWTNTAWLTLKSLTTAQRDALTPNVGDKIINTTTGTEQTYYTGTWNDAGTSTTPNASTTVDGKVEIATQGEVDAGKQIGWTGAFLTVWPDTFLAWVTPAININSLTAKPDPVGADYLLWADSAAWFASKKFLLSVLSGYMLPFYWYATDGNVTISTTITLTRDMYYNDLTISAGATYNPAWFKVFVAWTLTISGGTIQNNWSNASTSTWGAGWSGWNTWPNATTTSPGSNSSNITNTAITITDASWAAWACGNFARAWWSAGTNTAYIGISNSMVNQILSWIFVGTSGLSVNVLNPTCAGASGGSGNSGWLGGGGGWSGGKIIFIAKTVNITWGTINLNGGNGWVWSNTSNAQAWGGGGGWSGWVLMFLTESITRSWWTISLIWGNGWNAGIDTTTGYGGYGGNGGMGGRVYVIAKSWSIGSCTLTGGAAGALGTGGAWNGAAGSAWSTWSVITATYS